jgi:hypothetical protein
LPDCYCSVFHCPQESKESECGHWQTGVSFGWTHGRIGRSRATSVSWARGDASCRPTRRPQLNKRNHCTTAKHMAFAHASEFTYLQASCKLLIFVDCSFLCYVKFLKLFHGPMCSL